MHPNPDDEFSDPDVGPNESIVEKYVQEALDNLKVEADSFDGLLADYMKAKKAKVLWFDTDLGPESVKEIWVEKPGKETTVTGDGYSRINVHYDKKK